MIQRDVCNLSRSAWWVAVVTAALLAPASLRADEDSFVLRAGTLITAAEQGPWELTDGMVIVRDGRIVAVGVDLPIPPGLTLIELPDAVVLPGLVAASTRLAGEHRGDESVAAGYRAIDTYDPFAAYKSWLAGGVTTIHLNPGEHRLVTGQGAVVKLAGPPSARVLDAAADLTINFGEAAYRPPADVTYRSPASADIAITPGVRQRPDSRLGQYLALEEALARSEPVEWVGMHAAALVNAWRNEIPLRIHARRGIDISGAAAFVKRHDRSAYLVGSFADTVGHRDDIAGVAAALRQSGLPLVYRLSDPFRGGAETIGYDPEALESDMSVLAELGDTRLALSTSGRDSIADLRLAAATAQRAGLDSRRAIEAITRVPAEILGVADRVGSLVAGKDADLVVFSGDPLATSSHVQRVYVGGRIAFTAPKTDAVVVRAGTVWVNETRRIHDGAVLIEDGKISAVGHTVPHPRFARLIDAGPHAFISPGFIDAHSHLGLDGDRNAPGPDISLAGIIGVPDVTERRVARAGVTTVMLSPYKASGSGSQVTAVKTYGADRDARVVRDTAAVLFDYSRADPMDVGTKLTKRLEAGKKYLEKWQKYEKELAEWKEKQAKGESVDTEEKGATEAVEEVATKVDPITGTWDVTISGGPIPEPATASMQLKLTDDEIEGYLQVPGEGEQAKVVATLDGTHISGQIEIDTGGMGYPTIEADIVEDDHIVGKIAFQGMEVDLDAIRVDKSPVEFKVVKSGRRGKGGRPLPPKTDEALEPLRAVLESKIPLVVSVKTAAQIKAVLDTAKAFEVGVVLRDAFDATLHAETLTEQTVGVIVPTQVTRLLRNEWYHQSDDLARRGIPVAFQSNGEDGARSLPLVGLHAVERGMAADAALAALTTDASRMYKIDDRIGSLEPGREGDLLIFSGHPFEAGSRLQRVIVGGEEVR